MKNFNPAVDQYILKSQPFAQPILEHLRGLVHHACPEAEEKIKWGMPHFDYKGTMMCHMAAFKAHCAFGFWKAPLLESPKTDLLANNRKAMGHLGKITSLKDLPPAGTINNLIKQAMLLNDKGISIKKPAAKKEITPLSIPENFHKALSGNSLANATFKKLSPSHRNEYIRWITEAKRPETAEKRIQTGLIWLSEGKHLNWKYEKKTAS